MAHSPTDEDELLEEALALSADDGSLLGEIAEEPSSELDGDRQEPGRTEINTSGKEEDGQRPGTPPSHPAEPSPSTPPPPAESSLALQESDRTDEVVADQVETQHPATSHHPNTNREIEQESIKQTLHDIISEIDREMESDNFNEEVFFFSFPSTSAAAILTFLPTMPLVYSKDRPAGMPSKRP